MSGRYVRTVFPPGTVHHAAEMGSVPAITALEAESARRGYPPLVLLQARDDILGSQPLHVAAEKGHVEVIKYLARKGVDLDAGDGAMDTALHLAAVKNHLACVTTLLDLGANPTRQDSTGDQPLHWAATKGHVQVIELLLDRGAIVDAANRQGWTACHRAAYCGRVPALRVLLRRGASILALTGDRLTPLHLAAKNNQLAAMEALLSLGARAELKDSEGRTVWDYCVGEGSRDLLEQAEERRRQREQQRAATRPPAMAVQQAAVRGAASGGGAAAAVAVSKAPEMPRFRPNARFDSDGFPLPAAEPALGVTQSLGSEGEEEGEEEEEGEVLEEEQQQPPQQQQQQQPAGDVGSGPAVNAGNTLPAAVAPRRSGPGVLPAPAPAAAGLQARGAARPVSANKRFLDRYSLGNAGLFAPT